MRKSAFAAAALAAAMLALPAAFETARAFPATAAATADTQSGVVAVRDRDHRWRDGRRWHRGPVIRFSWRGGGNCAWLRHKANQTGSSYWWRRYRQCRR